MTADEGWVTDPRAIETLIALKEIRVGDEIECGNDCRAGRGTKGKVQSIEVGPNREVLYHNGHLWVFERHICAWRRPTAEKQDA